MLIDAGWLMLLLPTFVLGFFIGDFVASRCYCRHVGNARFALKHAEAYEAYKKAKVISNG